jgi:hypothetical protein
MTVPGAGAGAASAPVPPGNVGAAPGAGAPARPQPPAAGIDGWFLDRLFGRR